MRFPTTPSLITLFISIVATCFAHDSHDKLLVDTPILGSNGDTYVLQNGWGEENLKNGLFIKDCNGLVIDSKQRLIMLVNDPRNNVIIFDKDGKFIKTWTLNLNAAHGLSIRKEGDSEVLFITDNGGSGIVVKTDLDGKILQNIPFPKESGKYSNIKQYKPSDVLLARNGDFYVLDGYGENYIIHYNSKGEYVRIFGGDIGEGEARLAKWGPHGGEIDYRDPKKPVLIIACSDQGHLKRFSLDGEFIDTIKLAGSNPRDILIRGDKLYIPHLGSNWPKQQNAPGYISVLDKDNKVITNVGGTKPTYKDGTLQKMSHQGSTFIHPHALTIDQQGNLYVAQWNSKSTWPLKLVHVKGSDKK